jgi:signal transduction histidine kinase
MDNVIGEVGFRFASRFSQLIGRNLISNPIVAVSELVKNAYDADADNISVEFSNLLSGIPTLTIIDDGEGMSFEDISQKWMMVGTDNKVHNPFTSKGRRKLGEKGIGRFSVERLAKRLEIISSKHGDDFAIALSIDWDQYEIYEGEFPQLTHKVRKIPCDIENKGTRLILSDLRDKWREDELLDLQKEIELLRPIDINRLSHKKYSFPGNDVKIRLVAPEILSEKRLIDSHFIDYAQAHLYGEIKKDGSAIVRVNIKANISASKADLHGEYEYSPSEIDTSCGPVSYEAFVFLKDKRLYRSLEVENKSIDDYLKAFCGVKIYRDGFRILPFGDNDNDWLELNARRTSSPEFRIATYNSIGVVYITRDSNPGLQDVLSRENMYETPQFLSLKNFVNIAFDKYTALQLGARKKKERKVREEGKQVLVGAQKAVSVFANQIDALKKTVFEVNAASTQEQKEAYFVEVENRISGIFSSAEESLDRIRFAYSYYKKQSDFRSRETQIYRNIATLGISAAMFGHEALNQTVEAKSIINEVFADYGELIGSANELLELMRDLQQDLILINEKADFYRNYLRKEKHDRSRYINLYEMAHQLLDQHTHAFTAIGVTPCVETTVAHNEFRIWAYEGDFDTIFTNLITNAYKALKKASGEKHFILRMEYVEGSIIIHAINNGKLIKDENCSKIFEPMFSTYSDGTGLGLTIIQDTIVSYQGSISLESNKPDTHFKLVIPRREAPEEEVK